MSKHKQEVRTAPIELRIAKDGKRTLIGTAIAFNVRSQDLGGFQEVVSPGAVTDTLGSGNNIFLLANHDTSKPIASSRAGNLRITTDSRGVHFSADVDTRISYASDLALSVEAGVTAGCSFGFRTLKDSYTNDNGVLIRTLDQIEIMELTVTANPAYLQTQIDVRSCPHELRSLLNKRSNDNDCDCDCLMCLADDCSDCLDPDCTDPACKANGCPAQNDDDEDRSILSPSEVRRLQMRLALAKLR